MATDDSEPVLGTDAVHVYNVLWGIPESIGGMTTAVLRRIRSFQKYGRALSQTIVTFSPRIDTDSIRKRLLTQGKMRDDVELVNIWQELRGRTECELAAIVGEPPHGQLPAEDGELENITPFYDAFRNPSTGKVIRRNYLRKDGSLLVADVQDPKLGRRFVLHSPNGTPMAEWRRPRDFYNAWITSLVTEEQAVVIVDEKKVSEFIHEIPERTFRLVLFLHGTHLRHPWNGNHGQMLPRRVDTIRNLDRFDLVGVQTRQQAEAVRAIGFPDDNIRLLTGELPSEAVLTGHPTRRKRNYAVMIANLLELKRVDHAIRTVAKLRDRGIRVSLTVLGEGPERRRLEQLINSLDVGDRVELPGYVNDVQDRLKNASFSLLTSTSEGLPLSMMEAMGAGCIPIVYDITYGPRDLIEQGRNGYLTPWSDIDALADHVEEFLTLNGDQVDAMRSAAMATVANYLPEVAYRRWQNALEELKPAKLPVSRLEPPVPPIEVKRFSCEATSRGWQIEIDVDQIDQATASSLQLLATGRKDNTFFISSVSELSTRRWGRRMTLTFAVAAESFSESMNETFDIYLRRPHELWTLKRRVRVGKNFRTEDAHSRNWYTTKNGNLSVQRKL